MAKLNSHKLKVVYKGVQLFTETNPFFIDHHLPCQWQLKIYSANPRRYLHCHGKFDSCFVKLNDSCPLPSSNTYTQFLVSFWTCQSQIM